MFLVLAQNQLLEFRQAHLTFIFQIRNKISRKFSATAASGMSGCFPFCQSFGAHLFQVLEHVVTGKLPSS